MKTTTRSHLRLVNVIGIDGAGKTTLARNLAQEMRAAGLAARYRYCQYFAKLLYPFKLLARLSVMRRTDAFKNYADYNRRKQATSRRFPFLAGLYTFIWLFDYLFQVSFKVTAPVLFGQSLVIDRYIFDIAVNLSLTTSRQVGYAAKLVDRFLRFSIRPDLVIFIDLPEEIALQRKDDIPDIEYLRERRQRYLRLAKTYDFKIVDGAQAPAQVLKDTLGIVTGVKGVTGVKRVKGVT